ncbi:complement C1q-like protein 2 [Plectropomus leopardus]|uniref:complement C1q-like protein 2 n=1 Tax=Plectropomus leopardus TaxID=160734 RepID=UPI001C4CEED3|nr:complement C1q-like protein 2 [Plectropomus leopardus]
MKRVFLLLSLVSSSLCSESNSDLVTGTSMAVCQPDTCALLSEVAAMREKLAAVTQTQSTLQQILSAMTQKMATAEASLQFFKSQAEELRKINAAQDEQLKALAAVTSASSAKMAFTAALGSSVGPFEQDTPVKYQKTLSNIDHSYNPATGMFTARVRGMYYFSFTMYNNSSGKPNSVVSLMMNSQMLVSTWDTEGDDYHGSATNGAVVQLEAGDSVYVKLYAHRVLYDDSNHYNTFRGFLLFTL